VSYRYQVGSPTGSNTSRNVSVDGNGARVRVTYEVVGARRRPADQPDGRLPQPDVAVAALHGQQVTRPTPAGLLRVEPA
jgi:hypothetical protein